MQELTRNIRACCMFFILALHLSYLLNLNVKQRKKQSLKKKKKEVQRMGPEFCKTHRADMLVNIEL